MAKPVYDILPKRKDLRKHTLSDDCICKPRIVEEEKEIHVEHREFELIEIEEMQ